MSGECHQRAPTTMPSLEAMQQHRPVYFIEQSVVDFDPIVWLDRHDIPVASSVVYFAQRHRIRDDRKSVGCKRH